MTNPVKVLIVDDSPEDQELYRRSLRNWPEEACDILVAEDAEAGLEAIESSSPDVVLLDYLMPEMDGLEFLSELKRRARAKLSSIRPSRDLGIRWMPATTGELSAEPLERDEPNELSDNTLRAHIPPIIMLTGQGNEKVAVRALKEGIVDYVIKGEITPLSLQRSISKALEQRQLRASLERAEERFRASIETMLDSFGTYASVRDESGKIIRFQTEYINAAACGRNNMSMQQRGESLFVIEPPQWTEELFQEYCNLVETGLPLAKEIVIYNKDVLDRSQASSIQHAYDLRATRLGDGFVAVWREITGKKRAELERLKLLEQERKARAAAEEANQLKDTIVAMVSHDLRAPLNSILGWVQMLHRRPTEKIVEQATRIIERSARSQLSLIEDLMDMSRIMRGSLTLEVQPLSLTEVLGMVVTSQYPVFQDKRLKLALKDASGSLLITEAEQITEWLSHQPRLRFQGDANRLNQVLTNLLSNAFKFTPADGEIEIGLLLVADQAQVSVTDSGVGIEPDQLKRIFNRFEQAEGSRRSEGLGLGLTIAQHIAELHQGRLWATSEGLGKGATFTMELPWRASLQ